MSLYFKSDSVDGCVFLNRAFYVSEMVPYTVPRHGSCAYVWDGSLKLFEMGAVQWKVMRAAQLLEMVTVQLYELWAVQFHEWELDRFLIRELSNCMRL